MERDVIRLVLNDEHLGGVLAEAFASCRHRLFIATADVKDLYLPSLAGEPAPGGRRGRGRGRRHTRTILDVFQDLSDRGVEIHLLHSGVPSGAFLGDLKKRVPSGLTMRRCVRLHAKAVISDGRWMYLGSANLTGAGLGAKGAKRRNFEAGIVTDDVSLIDPVADMLAEVFDGGQCPSCGRRDYCPVPLEEPDL
jgi:phosphatidylserine/phosphatidylglycerophosphate/cardiolipin synthase-like enzyme